jgi:drug/metabolite transporter (DMT)-like permease
VVAILGGVGAALAFAAATLCNSRSSRMIGPMALVAWIMLLGLVLVAAPVALAGVPDDLDAGDGAWLAVAGVGNVAGLLLAYAGLKAGKVGVVAPLISTQGAVAALIAVLAGERLEPAAQALLAVVALGVVLAAVPSPEDAASTTGAERSAALLALGGALAIGASLYATGRVSAELPVAWALLPSRLIGVVAVTLPLAVRTGLPMTRAALPLVVIASVCEVGGFALFALGARHGIAVTAVLSSQFAALAALMARVLFGERLARTQVAGVAIIVAGASALSGVQA